MGQIKSGFVTVNTDLEELKEDVCTGRARLIDATNRTATTNYTEEKYVPSGTILLALLKFDSSSKGLMNWDASHAKMMKRHKTSTIQGNSKHFDSKGQYYSYGNKANFGLINLSSISQYSEKKTNMKKKVEGICLEELSQHEQHYGIASLSRHIPILPTLI